MPYRRDSFAHCPRCQISLASLRVVTGQDVLSCSKCKGIWTTPSAFRDIATSLTHSSRPPRLIPRFEAGEALACPECHRCMEQVALSARPNGFILPGVPRERQQAEVPPDVAVDSCRDHGMWFDFGELQKVLMLLASR